MRRLLQSEARKLNLMESRLEIYETLLHDMTQVACNEIRLAADPTSRSEKADTTIVTFRQARMLLNAISLDDLINSHVVLADISDVLLDPDTAELFDNGLLPPRHPDSAEFSSACAILARPLFGSILAS